MILHALWDFGSFSWAGAFAVDQVGPSLVARRRLGRTPHGGAPAAADSCSVVLSLVGVKKLFSTPVEMAD